MLPEKLQSPGEISGSFGIPYRTLLETIRSGQLPAIRINSRVILLKSSEVAKWLERKARQIETQFKKGNPGHSSKWVDDAVDPKSDPPAEKPKRDHKTENENSTIGQIAAKNKTSRCGRDSKRAGRIHNSHN